jgi:hypothetical protein
MTTTTQYVTLAQSIKADLRAAGYGPRQVTVRQRPCGYSQACTVTIRDAEVEIQDVHRIADAHSLQRVDCMGEPLDGCNRYVRVRYADEAAATRSARILPAVEQAAAELGDPKPANNHLLVEIAGTGWWLGWGQYGDRLIARERGNGSGYWQGDTTRDIARAITCQPRRHSLTVAED